MSDNQPSGVVYVKSPVVKVQVGGCEVGQVPEGERAAKLAEARELLSRYGRLERIGLLSEYETGIKLQGLEVEQLPLAVVSVYDAKTENELERYCDLAYGKRVEVMVGGQRLMLKPDVIHYGGLDASKPVSSGEPHLYLALPFQVRQGDVKRGIVIDADQFGWWCRQIPGQSKTG